MRILLLLALLIGCQQNPYTPTKERCEELIKSFGKLCMLNRTEVDTCCELYPQYHNEPRCLGGCY